MIRFLINGLVRDRSRSLFPVLMVAAGVFLTVLIYGAMQGAIGDMVDSNARFDTGYVKIMTRAYSELSDQVPNDLALLDVGRLTERLKQDHPQMIWTPRIRFGGLLGIPDAQGLTRAQGPVLGLGVDLLSSPTPEIGILNLEKALVRGRLPEKNNDILVSDAFARKLGVRIGEAATLLSATMHGSMAMHNFQVTGTVRFGVVALDRSTIIVDIEGARAALDMQDAAGEIIGFTRDMVYSEKPMLNVAKTFNAVHTDTRDEFAPVMLNLSEQGGLKEILDMADMAGSIIVGIFVFAMSVVLWNAGLMNGIRRYGEIGVRLAMGESKGHLYRSMIMESISVGIAGSVVGTLLGLAVSYWMQYHGLDYGSMMQKSTILISTVFRTKVTATSYYIGFFPGLFASVIGTMFAGIGIYRRQTSELFRELEV